VELINDSLPKGEVLLDDKYEKLNAHHEKVGNKIDALIKSIFLLSGMALTISVGIFNKTDALKLSPAIKCFLKVSWGSLFISIAALVFSLSFIVIENYRLGKNWFKFTKTNGHGGTEDHFSLVIWIETLLFIGVLFFIIGISGLALASISILDMR